MFQERFKLGISDLISYTGKGAGGKRIPIVSRRGGFHILSKLLILCFCLLAFSCPLLFAQTPAPEPPPAPSSSRTDVIFVPYDKMTGPEFGKDQSILIPYAQFLRLKKAWEDRLETPEFRPIASLVQAVYKGAIENKMVRVEAKLEIDTFARPKDRIEIVLPFQNISLESAGIEGASASLVPIEHSSFIRLILLGGGKRTVNLRLALPLVTEGGTTRLECDLPRAAASSMDLKIPEEVILVPLPGSTPASISKEEGGYNLRLSPGSSGHILLAFRPRMEKTGAAALSRFTVNQNLNFIVSPQSIAAQIKMEVHILTGEMSTLLIQIPQGSELRDISGPFVKDWSIPDAEGKCAISLVQKMNEDFSIQLNVLLKVSAMDKSLGIPAFHASEAVAETGLILLRPSSELSLWVEERSGLEPWPVSGEQDLSIMAYQFEQPQWSLKISKEFIPPRFRSESLVLYEVTEKFARIKSRHRITLSGRGIFDLSLMIPDGYELREAGPSALVSGFRKQGRRVEVNFRGEQRAPVELELSLQRERLPEEKTVSLEPIKVLSAEEDTGSLILATPLALAATEVKAQNLETIDVRTLLDQIRGFLSQDSIPVLAYRYVLPEFQALASIERQRTRLTCQTSRLISIMPSLMRVEATLDYNVEFSATDVFQLQLPVSVGEDVRFQGADIKEKFHTALKTGKVSDDDLTSWTIRLQRRIIGPYKLVVSFDVPISGADSGKASLVSVPPVRAAGVSREIGFIAVSRGENLEVRVSEAKGLEPRDIRELPSSLASAFLGFRYFDPLKHSLKLELVRHELETVLGALIRRVHIESVLNDQGEVVHEAMFEVQNNREQYLEMALPANMQIWSAFVRGVPVRPITRQADGARLIELTKSETRDTAFRVRLILREKLPSGPLKTAGSLVFNPPRCMNIPILRTTWKIYLPRNYRYIDFGGTMRLEKGMKIPWIEPAAEKLLNDIPARIAGGVAGPTINAPVSQAGVDYSQGETEEEKRARLQGEALEIPIVREGVQFVFSKLSDVGTIKVSYWKKKPLVLFQGAVALIVFLFLFSLMRKGKRPGLGFLAALIFFILASLTSGFAGRIFATAFAASAVAFGISLLVFLIKKIHLRAPMPKMTPQPAPGPPPDGYPPEPPFMNETPPSTGKSPHDKTNTKPDQG